MLSKCEVFTKGPSAKDFTKKELKMFDIEGFQRTYLKITAKEVTDEYMDGIRDIVQLQYNLPMRYMRLIPDTYQYISRKSLIKGTDKSYDRAAVTIEPLNNDYANTPIYTPINQSLPIGSTITVDIETPYDTLEDGTEPTRKFWWSNNITFEKDIKAKILKENPKSIHTEPILKCCHYGSIDVGSKLTAKYIVSVVNTAVYRSFSLFGFRRADHKKEFQMWVFKAYNMTPVDVLKMMLNEAILGDAGRALITEILSKVK